MSLKNASWQIPLVVILITLASIPLAKSTRPMVNSAWAESPPSIDGKFAAGEWAAPQIVFQVPPYPPSFLNASVYFVNDNANLYVMVDAVGDRTNDQLDEALLTFGFASRTIIAFRGLGGFECSAPATNCQIPQGVRGVVGYDTSPNEAYRHKIYEVSIPLKYVTGVGQSVDLCSPKANVFKTGGGKGTRGGSMGYDYATERDNVWPQGLDTSKIETWGILTLASATQQVPENTELTFPVCLMLTAVAFILAGRKHQRR